MPRALTPTGRQHGSKEESEQSSLRTRRGQVREERDAPPEEGHAQTRQVGTRRHRDEQEAGDRHRTLRSAREGRQGAGEAREQEEGLDEAGLDVERHQARRIEDALDRETIHRETIHRETIHRETLHRETTHRETLDDEAVHQQAVHSEAFVVATRARRAERGCEGGSRWRMIQRAVHELPSSFPR